MDCENNGKPYEQMDDLVGSTIFGNIQVVCVLFWFSFLEASVRVY